MQQVNGSNEVFYHFEDYVISWSDLSVFISYFRDVCVTSCVLEFIFVFLYCCMHFVDIFDTITIHHSLCLVRIFFALASPVFHAELWRSKVMSKFRTSPPTHSTACKSTVRLFYLTTVHSLVRLLVVSGTSIRIASMLFPWPMSWMFWQLRRSIWWQSWLDTATDSFRKASPQRIPFRCGPRYCSSLFNQL